MNAISSYKKQFKDAAKNLVDDETLLLKVNQEMATLQERKEELEKKIAIDRQNKWEKGMLYYSQDRRDSLLDKAKELSYSEQAIERLQSIDKEHWNLDHVDGNIIDDFESLEKYVKENIPGWEKSPITKLGKWINGNR
ncbi:MAG: hypothetical protein J1E06_03215 [Acutalibacter sp.]|nr:hypothetical protein [Acutalibacter sp.]